MPAYNAEQFIEQSIESVIAQTYLNWELIVINDGSTDTTENIVKNIASKEKRIDLINQPNKRIGGARNTGIKAAKGSWIAFLDSDDLWENTKLEKQILVSKNFPTVSVIYTNGYIFFNNNKNNCSPYPVKTGFFSSKQMYKLEYEANYIPVLSVLVKASLVNQIGFQEESPFFYGCEDWDYWLRMANAGADFFGIDEKLFYYRRHDHNMSSDNLSMQLAKCSVFLKNYRKNLLSSYETRQIFKPFTTVLVVNLLINKRRKEAHYLLRKVFETLPLLYLKFSFIAESLFGVWSVRLLMFADKADSFLNKSYFAKANFKQAF